MSIKYKNSVSTDEFIKIKHNGKVFTPDYLVEDILNQGKYIVGNINRKHVIENSCGDGQFMIYIVDRYCKDFLENSNDLIKLKQELETYIHAIEIEKKELDICIDRCNKVVEMYGIKLPVKWDFINADALQCSQFNNKMDFVVGNPPYVRVHNLNENAPSVKRFNFCKSGMTDLYIVFYEIGLQMLNNTGILTYITPSSFFTSLAGNTLRKYIVENQLLECLCDLKHFQPFNTITYTTIVTLNKSAKFRNVNYYEFDEKTLKPYFVENISISDYFINGNFYFAKNEKLKLLQKIINNKKKTNISVKNGYATLADKVFINDFQFDSKYIIPVLKASRGKWSKAFYPYDAEAKLVSEDELRKDEKLYSYLISKKSVLTKRSLENHKSSCWFAYGRAQAINDTYKDKISINNLIKTSDDLKIIDVAKGKGVYSGLYITTGEFSEQNVKDALLDKEFEDYIFLLGKYKSGGYYTFSSKDIKFYLDYKLGRYLKSDK